MPTPTPTDLAAMAAEILDLDARAHESLDWSAADHARRDAWDDLPVACQARAPALARAYLAAQARIEALEGALRGAKVSHYTSNSKCSLLMREWEQAEACDCGADEHNAAIDAALAPDPEAAK